MAINSDRSSEPPPPPVAGGVGTTVGGLDADNGHKGLVNASEIGAGTSMPTLDDSKRRLTDGGVAPASRQAVATLATFSVWLPSSPSSR